jgi:hypothetical protein
VGVVVVILSAMFLVLLQAQDLPALHDSRAAVFGLTDAFKVSYETL